jgi:pyruvate/2-oxoglutarate dehydrogenase complex dihydrolipoamide dehydrogenase (E3) component
VEGLAELPYWTNREFLGAKDLPASLAVLGGGAIGVELGQVAARFGSETTIIEAAPRLVPGEEPEAGDDLRTVLTADGIDVRPGTTVTRARRDGRRFALDLDGGEAVAAEQILVATGRRPDAGAVGLDVLGIEGPAAPVDERLRVTDGVWAVGDVTGIGMFTHVAVYQARIAAADILGEQTLPADYHALPRVTFTDPEIGSVGLTEQAALDDGLPVRCVVKPVASTARGWIHKAGNEGFIKLVVDARTDHLVGATVMGPAGGEVIGVLALAVHARVPVAQMRSMIYAYPTFHRGIEDALRDLE